MCSSGSARRTGKRRHFASSTASTSSESAPSRLRPAWHVLRAESLPHGPCGASEGPSSAPPPPPTFDASGRRPGTSPSTRTLRGVSPVQVYCDDILILSKAREVHKAHARTVHETSESRHHTPYAKASKCLSGRPPSASSAASMRRHLGARHRRRPACKVSAAAGWARPASCTDARRFAGLASYRVSLCGTSPLTALSMCGTSPLTALSMCGTSPLTAVRQCGTSQASPHYPLQPSRPLRAGPRRAAELRRAQGRSRVRAGAARTGP